MRLACNRKWPTVDNGETIYLECLWQSGNKECKEFFGLPLTVYHRHPLRFSVAHRVHGQQMQTGWTSLHPESLAERDDAKGNVLIESYFSNMAKLNFSDEDCNKINDHFKTVNIPLEYYDPSIRDDSQPQEIEITDEMLILADDVGPVAEDSDGDEGDDGNDDDGNADDGNAGDDEGHTPPSSPPPVGFEASLFQAVAGDSKLRKAGQLRVDIDDFFEVIEMNQSGRYSIST